LNRIILIGNGFDLAHGLRTSYNDFIDDFWEKRRENITSCFKKENTDNFACIYENDVIIIQSPYSLEQLPNYKNNNIKGYDWFKAFLGCSGTINGKKIVFEIWHKNAFLEIISEENTIQKWVDIEEKYYDALIDCQKNNGDIKKLNDDFHYIQDELQKYLLEQAAIKININYQFKEYFYSDFLKEDFIHVPFAEEFDKILFLNFNYTSTLLQYTYGTHDTKVINIHGELQNPNNPIIFGYGDEKDDNYKFIENKKNNDYLKYFKAFHYSRNNNYREVLKFINKNEYQIYIMGLSCGTSDRTLLNKLFEHNNCKSIKIFYHKESIEADNFLDIYMNISRNFTDKEKMRELIVSKENSLPLT